MVTIDLWVVGRAVFNVALFIIACGSWWHILSRLDRAEAAYETLKRALRAAGIDPYGK